jgi:hypothetical protein
MVLQNVEGAAASISNKSPHCVRSAAVAVSGADVAFARVMGEIACLKMLHEQRSEISRTKTLL